MLAGNAAHWTIRMLSCLTTVDEPRSGQISEARRTSSAAGKETKQAQACGESERVKSERVAKFNTDAPYQTVHLLTE
jgi:hypothetical protein